MKVYTARQAILNRKQNVVAYELLYREGPQNIFPNVDPHEATSKLIIKTHLNDGLHPLTSGKPALINFGEASLLSGLPFLLPQDQIMIEILEDVEPSDEVYDVCRQLFHQGYHLALDDFVYKKEWQRFFKFIKLIKFDVISHSFDEIAPLIPELKKRKNLKILAEKIETKAEFEQAKKLGFDYFQGYFFCKPEVTEKHDIEGNPQLLLSLYQEALSETLDIDKISKLFEQDLSLSYKLLRFINVSHRRGKQEIKSIKQAIIYLGEEQVRKLIVLLATSILSINKPKELLRIAIIRANFCELIARKHDKSLCSSAYLLGLFSLLDAILDKPIEEVIEALPLADDVHDVLMGNNDSPLGIILNTVKLYEAGEWQQSEELAEKIKITKDQLASDYQQAISELDMVNNN